MAVSVDFENMRTITGGNRELEQTLLTSFLTMAEGVLAKLQASLESGDEIIWREEAHALKGACLNLGAKPLSALCARAQLECRAAKNEKMVLLLSIHNEYAAVQQSIITTMTTTSL